MKADTIKCGTMRIRSEEIAANGGIATILAIACLFLLTIIVMSRQLGVPGYFSVNTIDTYTYTSWAWQFNEALKEGIIYPRWLSLNFWGYGSPTFVLYPPVAFYLVAFFSWVTDSLIFAMNLAKFTSLFFYGVGMFYLIKEFYPVKIAMLTASFCIIFPYNVVQYYLMGTFSSSVSFMWFPAILLFACRFLRSGRYQHLVYAGVCYGGLILTHLINAYMYTFVIVVFVCSASLYRRALRYFTAIPFILMTGFATSAAYLLPLVLEKRYFNLEAFIGSGYRYYDFFISPHHVINVFWKIYYGTFCAQTLFFFSILLVILLLTKIAQSAFEQDVIMINRCLFVVSLFSLCLLFGPSAFIWESIPFIKYVQFPVRWLNITTFATLILSAAGFTALAKICDSKRMFTYALSTIFLSLFLWDCYYIGHAPYYTDQELLPAKAVNWALEHLPTGVDTSLIANGEEIAHRPVTMRNQGVAEIVKWTATEKIIHLVADQQLTARLNIFNFPGWDVRIDDVPAKAETEEGSGAILVNVPKGEHRLKLSFEDTPCRTAGKVLSAISFALSMLVLGYDCLKSNHHKESK
jgi:hypothetical protein